MLQEVILALNPLPRLEAWWQDLDLGGWLLNHGGRAVVVTVAALLTARLVNAVIRRTSQGLQARTAAAPLVRQRAVTVVELLQDTAKYVIWGAAILLILNVDAKTVLGAAGIIGIAIGFGAQSLVKDVISGLFLVFEGEFSVGDVVDVNGVLGVVEDMGLRVVTLRDASGQRRFFSYGNITNVNNYTERRLTYRLNVPIAAEQEVSARDVLTRALAQFQQEFAAFTAPPEEEVLDVAEHQRLLRFLVSVNPFRRALVEQKLSAYLTTALKECQVSLPEGREITVLLEYPETAFKVMP